MTVANRSLDYLLSLFTPLVTAYLGSGLLAIFVPIIKYKREWRRFHKSYYYRYQYNNNNNNNNNNGESADRMVYDVNNCHWWNWRCESVWVNENGEYVQQEENNNDNNYNNNGYSAYAPRWFSGWGGYNGGSGDRGASRDGGASRAGSSASLKFVYAWQLVLFLGLLVYGTLMMVKVARGASRPLALQSLLILTFLWMNFSFLSMWMLANGAILTGGRQIEENGGFYTQFSVLMFMTDFWYTLWGLIFTIVFATKSFQHRVDGLENSSNNGGSGSSYLPYSEPSITKGSNKTNEDGAVERPNGTLYYK